MTSERLKKEWDQVLTRGLVFELMKNSQMLFYKSIKSMGGVLCKLSLLNCFSFVKNWNAQTYAGLFMITQSNTSKILDRQ